MRSDQDIRPKGTISQLRACFTRLPLNLALSHLVQTIFLPVVGLVNPAVLRPADLIGVNKDSYLILDTLPPEYDARVKAMEVDERPTEDYSDVGGLHKQIEELIEAVVLPITHKDRFLSIGIQPPKGVSLSFLALQPFLFDDELVMEADARCWVQACCCTARPARVRR